MLSRHPKRQVQNWIPEDKWHRKRAMCHPGKRAGSASPCWVCKGSPPLRLEGHTIIYQAQGTRKQADRNEAVCHCSLCLELGWGTVTSFQTQGWRDLRVEPWTRPVLCESIWMCATSHQWRVVKQEWNSVWIYILETSLSWLYEECPWQVGGRDGVTSWETVLQVYVRDDSRVRGKEVKMRKESWDFLLLL